MEEKNISTDERAPNKKITLKLLQILNLFWLREKNDRGKEVQNFYRFPGSSISTDDRAPNKKITLKLLQILYLMWLREKNDRAEKGEKTSTGGQAATLAQMIEHQIKKITFKLSQVLHLLWLREKNGRVEKGEKTSTGG